MADDDNSNFNIASPRGAYGSSIIVLTDPSEDLFQIECVLRGIDYDKDGNIRKTGDPLMNDFGISRIIGLIKSRAHKIQVMGTAKEDDINKTLKYIGDTIVIQLMINRKKFEINEADRTFVTTLILNYLDSLMKSAQDNGNRIFWKGSTHETTIRSENNRENSGFFGKVLGWGKS